MQKSLIIALCLSIFILSGCDQAETEQQSETEINDVVQIEEDIQSDTETDSEDMEMDQEENSETETESQSSSQAQYVAYSEGAIQEYEGQNKVIFFHASWCPTCRDLNQELEQSVAELPAGTVVMKADYDSETELRQQYGVNLQHTLVFVDDEGNQTQNNLIGADLEQLKAEL